MQDQQRFTMVAPAPGFTARVMTRLAERERARARRRALIGAALLVGAASVMLALAGLSLASAGWVLVTRPQTLVALLNAFETLAFWLGVIFNALWIAANAIAANLDPPQMLIGASAVFAVTMFWVRVVTGSFQLSSNYVGGFGR